jgi:hypothetical protein
MGWRSSPEDSKGHENSADRWGWCGRSSSKIPSTEMNGVHAAANRGASVGAPRAEHALSCRDEMVLGCGATNRLCLFLLV